MNAAGTSCGGRALIVGHQYHYAIRCEYLDAPHPPALTRYTTHHPHYFSRYCLLLK